MSKGAYARTAISRKETRPDRTTLRAQFQANRKIILATQSICAICGRPVDKTLKSPDPMSASIDHIIPVAKHGDPVSLDNLQLAHRCCNRKKGTRLYGVGSDQNSAKNKTALESETQNGTFRLSFNWKNY